MSHITKIGKKPLVTKLDALFPHKKNNMLN